MCTCDLGIISARTWQLSLSPLNKFSPERLPVFPVYWGLPSWNLLGFVLLLLLLPSLKIMILFHNHFYWSSLVWFLVCYITAWVLYLSLTMRWAYIHMCVCVHREIILILQIRVLIHLQPRYNAVIPWQITRDIYIKIAVKSVHWAVV